MELQVRLVGPLAVVRDGRVLGATEVGSHKARLLLGLLAAAGGRVVPVDRIVAALWAGPAPKRPAENVATLVSRVRAALGAGVVVGGRGGYRLGDRVGIDLVVAAAQLGDAESRLDAEPALALVAARQAADRLGAAPLLADEPDADWIAAARDDQAGLLRRARHDVARAALRTGQPALAREAAVAALRTDAFDEAACRSVMRAHDALGEPALAVAAFERLRALLADELGVDPAAETRELHVAILRGERLRPDGPTARDDQARPDGTTAHHDRLQPDGTTAHHDRVRPERTTAPHDRVRPDGTTARHGQARPDGTTARHDRARPSGAAGRPDGTNAHHEPARPGGAAGRPDGTAAQSDLPGRERELASLRRAWAEAAAGRGSLTLISGEAGIGKTRLGEEVAKQATAGRVLTARCYEAESSLFLQPIVEVLTRLVATLPEGSVRDAAGDWAGPLAALVPEVATLLGAPPREHGSPDVQRRRAYDAVVVFLRRLARDEPVLLLIDDLQNAGTATVELLHYLARHLADARLLVVATVRSGEGASALSTLAAVARTVELGALDTAAITRLAAAAGQSAHVTQLERRTRGHTLFVVESLRALAAGEPGVPESLRAGVLARVARAGPDAEELLRAAAVLGPSFAPGPVAGLLGIAVEEATLRCQRTLGTRLTVVAGRSYEFANDLVQEVLYETTPAPTRLAHHLRAADLLADNPEAVARHAQAGGDDRRAARAWLAAGHRAAKRYAMADAEALYKWAIVAAHRAGDEELLGRGRLVRGRVREAGFRFEEALSDYTVAAGTGREIGDRRLEMAALRELGGPVWTGSGRPADQGAQHVRLGLRLAEQLGDRGAEAGLLGWLAVLDCNQLRFADAARHSRQAHEAAVASGDETAMLAALDARKTIHAYLGEVTELSAVLDDMEPRVRRAGNLFLLQWCVFESAFPQVAAGRWAVAADLLEEAVRINARSGYTGYTAWFVAHQGWLARLSGRTAEALRLGERAAAMDSHAWFATAVQAIYANTLLESGDPATAIPVLERALAAAETHGTAAYRLRCLAPLAEATGSAELLRDADDALRAIQGPPWLYASEVYFSVARAWRSRGDTQRAAEIEAPVRAAGRRNGWLLPDAQSSTEPATQSSSASIAAARAAPSVSTGR